MGLKVPITNRARQYGYFIWPAKQDEEIKRVFRGVSKIDVWFESSYLGEKNIDWRNRRVSLGPRQTRSVAPESSVYLLTRRKDGSFGIKCSS